MLTSHCFMSGAVVKSREFRSMLAIAELQIPDDCSRQRQSRSFFDKVGLTLAILVLLASSAS